MRLDIYDRRPEIPVRLALQHDEDGGVELCVVDADGDAEVVLLTITTEGECQIAAGANRTTLVEAGMQFDQDGQLVVKF